MSRKTGLLLILLLIASAVLSACGGDKKEDKGDSVSATPVPLTQTYESESGIILQLPDGWVAEDYSGGVRAVNSQEFSKLFSQPTLEEIPAGMADVEAQVLPLDSLAVSAGTTAEVSMKDLLTSLLPNMIGADPAVKSSKVEEIRVGGREAARTKVSSDKMEGAIHVVRVDENSVALVSYLVRPGELKNFEGVLSQIVQAIGYATLGQ